MIESVSHSPSSSSITLTSRAIAAAPKIMGWLAMIASGSWAGFWYAYIHLSSGFHALLARPPFEVSEMVLGLLAVPAVLLATVAQWTRTRQMYTATELLRRQSRNLSQTVRKRLEPGAVESEVLRAQSLMLSESAEETLKFLQMARAALRRESESLQALVTENARQVAAMSSMAEREKTMIETIVQLDRSGQSAAATVEKLKSLLHNAEISGDRLIQQMEQASHIAHGHVERLGSVGRTVEDTLSGSVTSLEQVGQDAAKAGAMLTGTLEHILSRLDATQTSLATTAGLGEIERFATLANRLMETQRELDGAIAGTGEKLDGLAGRIGDRIATLYGSDQVLASRQTELGEMASRIETQLAEMQQVIAGQGSGAETTAAGIARLAELGKSIQDQGQELDRALGRMDEVSGRFKSQVAEAGEAEQAIVARLESVGASLARTRGEQNAVAADVEKLEGLLHDAEQAGDRMIRQIEQAAQAVDRSVDRLESTGRTSEDNLAASIDNLEALGRDAARAGNTLTGMLDQILARMTTAQNSLVVTGGLGEIERFAALAERLAETQRSLDGAIGGTGEKLESLTSHISGRIGSVAEADRLVMEQQKQLGETAVQIERQLGEIRATLAEHAGTGENATGSIAKLAEFSRALETQKRDIDRLVGDMLGRIDAVSGRLGTEISQIGEAERTIATGLESVSTALVRTRGEQEAVSRDLDAMGERTAAIAVKLEGLRSVAVTGAGDMMAEADRLQARTEALSVELRSHSGVIQDAVGRAAEIGGVLRGTSTLLSEITDRASEASRQIRTDFGSVAESIELQGERLAERAAQASNAMDKTRIDMEGAVASVHMTLGGLDRRAGEINVSVGSSLARLQELTRGIERARDEVGGSSDDVAAHLQSALQALNAGAEQTQAKAEEIGRIADHAEEVTQRLEGAAGSLRSSMADIAGTADQANEKLRQSSREFADSTAHTREQFAAVADRLNSEGISLDSAVARIGAIETALREAGALVQQMADQAAATTGEAEAKLRAVGHEISLQAKIVSGSSEMTGEAMERTRAGMDAMTEQVNEAFGSLNRKASEINFAVSTAVNRLGELGRGLETARDLVGAAGNTAGERLMQTTNGIKAEFENVCEVSNRALERLERTSAAIASGSVDAEAATQVAEARVAGLLNTVHGRNDEITQSVTHAIAEFEKAERSLVTGQQRLASTAEETAEQFLRLVRELANAKFEFATAVTGSSDTIASASALMETRFTAMNRIAETAQAALGGFGFNLDQLAARSAEVTRQLTEGGTAFNASIASIKQVASDAAEELQKSATLLIAATADIADGAGRGRTEIQRVINALHEESRVIAESQEDARGLAAKAAAMLKDKALEIANAARLVATEAASLRATETRTRRDLFLGAAKSVLDELQSLSVDLSRVLDKDLPEKMWRSATRADMSTFTRRLAGLRDTLPVNEVRTRFMADTAFRGNVQTYLRQFEELLDQASADEQGDILTSALMSSDVGKIYYFLSGAVGRDRTLQQTG